MPRDEGRISTPAVVFSRRVPPHLVTVDPVAPEPGETLVDIDAAAVNHLDVTLARAALDSPDGERIGGTEAVGRVRTSRRLPVGTRVHISGAGVGVDRRGLWATEAVVPDDALVPIPEDGDAAVLATHVTSALSAYAALFEVGRLQPGERVAVTGPRRGVGAMAVALARRVAGVSVVPLVAGRDPDESVDLLIDVLGGTPLAEWLGAGIVRPGGRAVLVGYLAGQDLVLSLPMFFRRGVSLLPLDVMRLGPGLVDVRAELAAQLGRGELPVEPVETIPLAAVPELLRRRGGLRIRAAVEFER